jgi:hypothetical protein
MCYVKPYICEYQKYYYRIDDAVKPQYREMFYNKLPINVGNILKEEWRTKNQEIFPIILGARIKILQEYILKTCTTQRAAKQIKRMDRFCCDKKNVELLGRYECIIPTQKKYYKKKKTYKNYDKRNYKRQKFRFKNIIIINTRKIITQILE